MSRNLQAVPLNVSHGLYPPPPLCFRYAHVHLKHIRQPKCWHQPPDNTVSTSWLAFPVSTQARSASVGQVALAASAPLVATASPGLVAGAAEVDFLVLG